ncbi:MAG: DUF4147 domain-containing protein [Gammaproteobacteria bacterium]|nr:DUF4147 domain-containing protein [Gammaproteobacteria bacterium]
MRERLLSIFEAGLSAVEGNRAVSEALKGPSRLGDRVYLVAIGKAAAAMAAGARDSLGPTLVEGLVITKHGHGDDTLPYEIIESGHPKPDQASLNAGQRLLDFLGQVPSDASLLFLISGGASALVEVLPEGMGLEDLQRISEWLLGSGLAIDEMNRIRKALSLIKGGRLSAYMGGRPTLNLIISDVPDDNLTTIGSGLLVPAPTGHALPELPEWIERFTRAVPQPPSPHDACFDGIDNRVIANNRLALEAMAEKARALGFNVHRHEALLEGLVGDAAQEVRQIMLRNNGLHLWGGETTVELPNVPGRGGRNQHLALLLAQAIANSEDLVLCAGTDGTDGPTEDAGALVDGQSILRGELHYEGGVQSALDRFDAGQFLEASGDLINTGPTGTNVMDVVLAYHVADT